MRTDTVQSLPQGLYRPGSGFSAAELHAMVLEGAVRPLLGDLYACTALPDAPRLRALACRALLSGSLRAHAVLCGESAAWVHLGAGTAPSRITVITAGVYRRRTAGPIPWQVHQVPLSPDDQLELQGVPVTTPLRTAADIFLGVGTVQSRRALDAPRAASRPAAASNPGPAPTTGAGSNDGCAQRWAAIRRLCVANPKQIQPAALLQQIQAQLGGHHDGRDDGSRRRRDRIEGLLAARVFSG
ncbi:MULTISPECIES: hypothetical protein [unclassified Nesterenkonia]|uniref:hypothetical protein n=1 Tax=unclassified Nesterenkonia TaxID=2629769 RepID=UPI001F4CA5ED|nr:MULTISPECIES: hypothetical protein [unclassified Nesterenkonia]MCH8561344.1 hypothetical protein [Nesterenkonia sp. DZ6]MCH8562343.1 hypothetical protein [Nesterenkonia sp. YGD6]